MNHNMPSHNYPSIESAGGDLIKGGRDAIKTTETTNTTNTNVLSNNWISVILIGVLALGGAWGLGLRIKLSPNGVQLGGDVQPQQPQSLTK